MALFNRQKAEKGKCKGQESTIGKIIYSFLLFMPILAVGVACLYVVFNKNAYQSYSDTLSEESIQLANGTHMYVGTTYTLTYTHYGTNTNYRYTVLNNNTDLHKFVSESYQNTIIGSFAITHTSGVSCITIYDNLGNQIYASLSTNPWYNRYGTFYFQNGALNDSNTAYTTYDYLIYTLQATTNKLDNVFYYELERLEQSNLFNWTKNTGTYDVIHNTTTLLGITNTYMPMLLTYWLIVSIIYFVYDIGLMLVWVMHRKIHELQESI